MVDNYVRESDASAEFLSKHQQALQAYTSILEEEDINLFSMHNPPLSSQGLLVDSSEVNDRDSCGNGDQLDADDT